MSKFMFILYGCMLVFALVVVYWINNVAHVAVNGLHTAGF
jgi:hypothetical protein